MTMVIGLQKIFGGQELGLTAGGSTVFTLVRTTSTVAAKLSTVAAWMSG